MGQRRAASTRYIGEMEQERANLSQELRAMMALAVPVVLSELGWMAMGVVDTIMVGRLGPAAIGAVALGNAICYTPSHLWHGVDAGAGYAGGAGLRAQGSRRVPSLAGAGRVSGVHCSRAHYAGDLAGEPWLYPLRDCGGSGRAGERISAAAELGHVAAAALRGHAALFAGRGPGARHYRDLCAGEPGQLVWELGADLRQAGFAGAGRERVGDFDGVCAGNDGRGAAGVCLALRARARASAVPALGRSRRPRG